MIQKYLNYEYITSQKDLSKVVEWIKNQKFYLLDTETTGLSPFSCKIVLLQLGNLEKQWIVDNQLVDITPLRPYIENDTAVKLGQNIKHDLKFLMWHYKWWNIKNVVDTMINEQIIRCGFNPGASLEDLALRYLGIQIDKDEDLRKSFWTTPAGEFNKRQLDYAAGDVIYPLLIAQKQKPLIIQRGLTSTLKLEYKVIPVLAKMELRGMAIDIPAWNALHDDAVIKKNEMEKKLNEDFKVQSYIQEGMFGEDDLVKPINYDSPKQVKKALVKFGYIVEDTNKNSLALAAITGQMPVELAQHILLYKKYATRVSRYGVEFLKALEPITGRIHTDFTQCFTTTGRLSSREDEESDSDKVNLQNIPRKSEYRSCFIPRPGYVFIVYDYQAIEPRILGEISHDPTYLYTFDNNKDLYGVIGMKILQEEVSKAPGRPSELREKTKITVLGNSYGTGKEKFYKKMLIDMNLTDGILNTNIKQITREESDMMWEQFFEVCPNVKSTLDKLSDLASPEKSKRRILDEIASAEDMTYVAMRIDENFNRFQRKKWNQDKIKGILINNRKYVTWSETLGGRKRYFKVYHSSSWTEGRNHPIQGTAADILKTAMVEVDDAITAHKNDAFLVNQVHDELIIEVKAEQAAEVDAYIKPILLQSESKFLKRVPAKVEGGIKTKWEK